MFCLHVVWNKTKNVCKNGGHRRRNRRVGLDQVEREKVTSHLGDIRSLACEQSRPTGEQSRSLELRYYRLVGPSVWKCTCRRAGLQLRMDVGGGVGFFGAVSCQSVCLHFTHSIYSHTTHVYCSRMFLRVSNTGFSSACLFYYLFYLVSLWFFLFAVSFFLFSSDTIIMPLPPPSSLLSSCRPSLLPSIPQTLVGSRTISRGSW